MALIPVYPKGDLNMAVDGTLDKKAVQSAIDKAGPKDIVLLKRTAEDGSVKAFYFGPDSEKNTSVYITKEVTIHGERVGFDWATQGWGAGSAEGGTTIAGGREPFIVGQSYDGALNQANVTIRDIRFTNFYRSAIRICATRQKNVISGCSFVEYGPSSKFDYFVPTPEKPTPTKGAWPIICRNSEELDAITGSLLIEQNYFVRSKQIAAGDNYKNNLLEVTYCNLTPFEFRNNRIADMYGMGIVVYGNKGQTKIVENNITKTSTWPVFMGAGIVVGLWSFIASSDPFQGEITIEDNTVEVQSPNSSGIVVGRLPSAYYGLNLPVPATLVRGNTVYMGGNDEGPRAALACLGACSDSRWEKNTVKGVQLAEPVVNGDACYGIWVTSYVPSNITNPPPVLIPSNNVFSDNDLEGFTARKAQVFIGDTVNGLKLIDNRFGPVSGTNLNAPPLDDAVAGIRCKGDSGAIAGDDFKKSKIQGWNAPPYVGCIYLDQESFMNKVNYAKSQFPPNTLQPVANQIYDDKRVPVEQGKENILQEDPPAQTTKPVKPAKPIPGAPKKKTG